MSWTQEHEDFWLVREGGPNSRGERVLKENKLFLTPLWKTRLDGLRAQHAWVKDKGLARMLNGNLYKPRSKRRLWPDFGARFEHEAQKPRLAETAGASGFALSASSTWAGAHRLLNLMQQPVPLLPKESEEDYRNAQQRMLKLTLKANQLLIHSATVHFSF